MNGGNFVGLRTPGGPLGGSSYALPLRITSCASVLVLTWLTACGGGGGGAPPPPPNTDLLALTYFDDGGFDRVLVADVGGSGIDDVSAAVRSGGATAEDLAWSSDHRFLAWIGARDGSADGELFVFDVDLGIVRSVSEDFPGSGEVNRFAWAAGTNRIAFVTAAGLFADHAEGGDPVELSTALPGASQGFVRFALSPDGTRIAVATDGLTVGVRELFVLPLVGGPAVRVSNALEPGAAVQPVNPVWSPTGLRLAFTVVSPLPGTVEVWSGLANGTKSVRMHPAFPAGRIASSPAWSADGAHLAYIADQLTDDVAEAFVVDEDGTNNKRVSIPLVAGGEVSRIVWAPVGSLLAHVADAFQQDELRLFVVRGDSGAEHADLSGPMNPGGAVRASSVIWRPDGARIAYVADQAEDGAFELYVARPDIAESAFRASQSTQMPCETVNVAWSPDGTHVIYRGDHTDGIRRPFAVQPGLPPVPLTPTVSDELVGFTPDGLGAVSVVDNGGHLAVCPLDGSASTDVVDLVGGTVGEVVLR
ncbi:MAG: hypothetical protein R3F05_20005 [Planctomycetota bacterium]